MTGGVVDARPILARAATRARKHGPPTRLARRLCLLAIAAGIGFALTGCGPEGDERRQAARQEGGRGMTLTSPEFQEGERIPTEFTCDGRNISPPLEISGVPDSAQSLALIMDDPDANGVFVHWLLWNVPTHVTSLPAGIPPGGLVAGLSPAAQGINGAGVVGFRGSCPPPGPDHHYRFRLFALDTTLSLDPGIDRDRLEQAMEGHVLEESVLTATYSR